MVMAGGLSRTSSPDTSLLHSPRSRASMETLVQRGQSRSISGMRSEASTWRGGPSMTTRPPCRATTLSAYPATTSSRCPASTMVRPASHSRRSMPRTAFSPAGSRKVVGSSSTSTGVWQARAAASTRRCSCPPERWCGEWSAMASSPVMWSASRTRRSISLRSTPRFSRPKATSSRTVNLTPESCCSGLGITKAMCAAMPATFRAAVSCPHMHTRPCMVPGRRWGTTPARARQSVDFPALFAPASATNSPAPMRREMSFRAGEEAPA